MDTFWRTAAALGLIVAVWPAAAQSPKDTEREERRAAQIRERMNHLTPADFQRFVTVTDDALETQALITTEPGFRYHGRFTDRVRTDSFLRAIISKGTGSAVFQVYATTTYGGDWRHYRSATYAAPGGPRAAEVIPVNETVNCRYGCVYSEDVSFLIDEATLRQIAATYRPGDAPPWRFRFTAQTSDRWTEEMSPAESRACWQP